MCKYCDNNVKYIYEDEQLCYDCLLKRMISDRVLIEYDGYYYVGDICIGNNQNSFNLEEVIENYDIIEVVNNYSDNDISLHGI